MRYANNIKVLQNAKGWTIDRAAAAMGMSRGGYLKIQRGENRLTSTTIELAAKAFGVSESEILPSFRPIAADTFTEFTARSTRQGMVTMNHESGPSVEYSTIVAPDGTTALPVELREVLALKPGDRLEFFRDHAGGWQVRPRNAGPLDFLKFLPQRPRRADVNSDDEALTKALSERNLPPSATKAAE